MTKTASKTPTRIYVVKDLDPDSLRLVRATSQAAAIRHACRDYTAQVATQTQLVNLLGAGVKVEEAGAQA